MRAVSLLAERAFCSVFSRSAFSGASLVVDTTREKRFCRMCVCVCVCCRHIENRSRTIYNRTSGLSTCAQCLDLSALDPSSAAWAKKNDFAVHLQPNNAVV